MLAVDCLLNTGNGLGIAAKLSSACQHNKAPSPKGSRLGGMGTTRNLCGRSRAEQSKDMVQRKGCTAARGLGRQTYCTSFCGATNAKLA